MHSAVDVIEVAEAGFSECADVEGVECMPGFGAFLATIAVGGTVLVLWLCLSIAATSRIVADRTLSWRTRAWWILAVWTLPVVGAGAWFAASRQREST